MLRLKISSKILLYFLVVSLVPLVVAMYLLVSYANTQLLKAASSRQQAVASDLTDRVNNYLDVKTKNLTYQAQIYSTNQRSSAETDQNLAVLFNQDRAIQRVSILDVSGKEQAVFDRNGKVSTHNDESASDAYKAINFLAGKNYISSVSYTNNIPSITIAVPILNSNFNKYLTNLPAANFGNYSQPDDIKGAIVAHYDTSDLWQSVLSTKIGNGGYAYVVDSLGNLVAHPDNKFLASHQKLSNVTAVKDFTQGNSETKPTTSEIGQNVISTPRLIANSGWAVIVEEPVASIYASINSFIKLSAIIGLAALALSVLMSIFFRKQLIEPIKQLSKGAKRLGEGEFDQKIELNSKDELQDLADTFNKMASDINKLVVDLTANNKNLKIEQTKLNNIISSVSDGIIALDNKGRIVSINPPAAKLIEEKPADLRGKTVTGLFQWQQNDNPFIIELEKPGLYHYTDLILTFANNVSYLDLMVSVIDNHDSDVAAIITIHDMTQSRELDFMKLDFVAIAAHELRTPLTVVTGYLDILNKAVSSKLTIFDIENLQKAIVGSNQLRDLINKLLNIARIERGEMDLFIEKINLTTALKENVNQHKTAANQKEQTIVCNIGTGEPVYVPVDPSSLTEVLNNLLGNAIKFTPKGGKIKVVLQQKDGQAQVAVMDNGPGVPTELRDRLFTKFYRAERSLIAGTRGTGLGLFISKTIIEKQGGKIGILPDNGQGSTFYFTLPIYNAAKHDKLISRKKQSGGIRGWFKKRTNS